MAAPQKGAAILHFRPRAERRKCTRSIVYETDPQCFPQIQIDPFLSFHRPNQTTFTRLYVFMPKRKADGPETGRDD